jgi:hypothetical protein
MRRKRQGVNIARSKPAKVRKIVGVGKFSSKTKDLGSNKRHLQNFGR